MPAVLSTPHIVSSGRRRLRHSPRTQLTASIGVYLCVCMPACQCACVHVCLRVYVCSVRGGVGFGVKEETRKVEPCACRCRQFLPKDEETLRPLGPPHAVVCFLKQLPPFLTRPIRTCVFSHIRVSTGSRTRYQPTVPFVFFSRSTSNPFCGHPCTRVSAAMRPESFWPFVDAPQESRPTYTSCVCKERKDEEDFPFVLFVLWVTVVLSFVFSSFSFVSCY